MVTFDKSDQVFLRALEKSQSLSTDKVPKLSPRYCGPITILKRIGKVAYKLALPKGSQVHPVFHVSRLRKRLYDQDQVIDSCILVDYEESQVLPHEPKKIMDTYDLRTRHHI